MELKELIFNTESRYISYKKMIEDVHKDKVSFPPDSEYVKWYKDMLRDGKNYEEGLLRRLIEEKKNEKEGLNPPYCYKY